MTVYVLLHQDQVGYALDWRVLATVVLCLCPWIVAYPGVTRPVDRLSTRDPFLVILQHPPNVLLTGPMKTCHFFDLVYAHMCQSPPKVIQRWLALRDQRQRKRQQVTACQDSASQPGGIRVLTIRRPRLLSGGSSYYMQVAQRLLTSTLSPIDILASTGIGWTSTRLDLPPQVPDFIEERLSLPYSASLCNIHLGAAALSNLTLRPAYFPDTAYLQIEGIFLDSVHSLTCPTTPASIPVTSRKFDPCPTTNAPASIHSRG
ncbi:hypothetical protein DOTSEDRAFT_38055 [Dothistroma septosporum NZE10]|uniref:Uncharacterized protein n=1 Tax=Dothistroma septosporum (strain NZE10 / CBS 128990) TaxID=675120 RepID=N1PC83_DOTSN|nr:hypothetical protein DOTSEDRAFT_38055 [Dothistroma septosporum NZE10]